MFACACVTGCVSCGRTLANAQLPLLFILVSRSTHMSIKHVCCGVTRHLKLSFSASLLLSTLHLHYIKKQNDWVIYHFKKACDIILFIKNVYVLPFHTLHPLQQSIVMWLKKFIHSFFPFWMKYDPGISS